MDSANPGKSGGGTPEALPAAQVNFTPSAELFPFASNWFESSVGRIHRVPLGVSTTWTMAAVALSYYFTASRTGASFTVT